MAFRLTREQLYDLVWSQPMRRLSQQIGISDVAIAKHCRKLGLPVPERGYWNKIQAGQKVSQRQLPPGDLGTIKTVEMSGTLGPELRALIKGELGSPSAVAENIDVLTGRFRRRLGRVAVPSGFSPTHPLIAKLLAKEDELRQKYASEPYSWNLPRFDSPFERRRLRFLNGLFLGFAKVGGNPWLRGDDARELSVYMGDSSVSFTLDATGSKGHARRAASDAVKGREELRMAIKSHSVPPSNVPMTWEDRDDGPIEKQITEIIVGMAVAGEHLHRIWIEQQIAWKRQREEEAERREREHVEEQQRKEQKRLEAIVQAKRDTLIRDAKGWRDAVIVRAYVAAVQSTKEMAGGANNLEDWSKWALAEADILDPIASGRTFRDI